VSTHDQRQREERQRKALDLHLTGLSYSQIAAELGTSKSRAHDYVKTALGSAVEAPPAGMPSLDRDTALARLDAMLSGLWPKARTGDVAAVDRVLKIEERRAQLLATASRATPVQDEDHEVEAEEGVPVVADITAARARRLADAEGGQPS
jgi:hypothetical protein